MAKAWKYQNGESETKPATQYLVSVYKKGGSVERERERKKDVASKTGS
jgi:hypothetical protein